MYFKTWLEEDWTKFWHQKEFPFMREPDRPLYRNARSFLRQTPEYGDDYDDWPYQPEALYHVTSNLRGVMRDQRLKSRSQLGGQASGFGGLSNYESPRSVSLTYNLGRAKEMYDAFHFVVAICQNRIPASEIYSSFEPGDNYEGQLSNVERVAREYGVPRRVLLDGDAAKIGELLDKKVTTGEEKYDLYTALEEASLKDEDPGNYSDSMHVRSSVGFAAPFTQMVKVNPKDIAIIQVVLRKDAKTNHIPQEAEFRVDPKDLAVVRYLQPKAGR